MKLIIASALLALAAPSFAVTNLVTNGDFAADGANWTVVSNAYFFDGAYREGAVDMNGTISQTFASGVGGTLTVEFDYAADDSSSYQYVSLNGNTIAGSLISGPVGYTHYVFTLGAGTGADTITFNGRNNPSFNVLDNVVVTQVPEPASWALMIAGFGMIGFAMRRRAALAA